MDVPSVSIVIPALRDAGALAGQLERLPVVDGVQVIVADGAPDDPPTRALRARTPDVLWVDAAPGRARQMNAGAARATGAWLLFLHADARLGDGWRQEVARAAAAGCVAGCFRLVIDSPRWPARVIELAVRLRVRWLGLAYGDQALFLPVARFAALGGYRDLPIMEDADLVRRVRRLGRWYRASTPILVSARRWERDGWWRRTAGNLWILVRYLAGRNPERLAASYPVWRPPPVHGDDAGSRPQGSASAADRSPDPR